MKYSFDSRAGCPGWVGEGGCMRFLWAIAGGGGGDHGFIAKGLMSVSDNENMVYFVFTLPVRLCGFLSGVEA